MAQENPAKFKAITLGTGAVLLALLVVRIGAVILGDYELYADEAQYWRWSRDLDWGYYSKPPMIAWVIAASTWLFGHAEWAIRLPAPVLHTLAAGALFLLGRSMYGVTAGALGALGYALMPGVIVSSAVISTDGVLLPIWSLALLQLWRLREGANGWLDAAALGALIGLCFLAKYAALYFVIGIGLTVLVDRETRAAILSPAGALAGAIATLVFAPHLAWNLAHDFSTVSHTVDNANLGGPLLNPGHLPKFLADQMGVFGPVGFIALVAGLFIFPRTAPPHLRRRDRWLLCFILPVLIIIAFQSVLSRAHANWAATAYPAASVLVAAWLLRAERNRTMWLAIAGLTLAAIQLAPDISMALRLGLGLGIAGLLLGIGAAVAWRPAGLLVAALVIHATIMVAAATTFASPPQVTAQLGLDNALKRVRGWEELTDEVIAAARQMDASAILVDERELWHALDYYGRDSLPAPLIAWRRNAGVKSFSENRPMQDAIDDRVLLASYRPGFRPRIRADFAAMERTGTIDIALGTRSNGCPIVRQLVLYRLSGFRPEERTAEWEARYDGLKEAPPPPCPPAG